MYDLYPEWGPARHRDDEETRPPVRRPRYWRSAVMAGGPEARDAAGDRPDDN